MSDFYAVKVHERDVYITWNNEGGNFWLSEKRDDPLLTNAKFFCEKLNIAYKRGEANGFEKAEKHFNVGRAAKGLLD